MRKLLAAFVSVPFLAGCITAGQPQERLVTQYQPVAPHSTIHAGGPSTNGAAPPLAARTSETIESLVERNPQATDDEIYDTAKLANALEFIDNFPEGIDTNVLERGKKLSQGQRQLVSLARAFLVNPRILLLDEATASIDPYSEALIQEAIHKLLEDRTSIIIAHRLTTVKRADRIIVLENGKIIEEGTHNELLQRKQHYADLYEKFFAFQEVTI